MCFRIFAFKTYYTGETCAPGQRVLLKLHSNINTQTTHALARTNIPHQNLSKTQKIITTIGKLNKDAFYFNYLNRNKRAPSRN